ncbi:hypothetical protein ACJROX_19305 [Pseudalkalibacillus sp. A8]|uniref:hypothetical protein n=1 Tax=Pseudalkalibacillus sp. A8 TaxID=3382641 RepID=UPI0038B571CB
MIYAKFTPFSWAIRKGLALAFPLSPRSVANFALENFLKKSTLLFNKAKKKKTIRHNLSGDSSQVFKRDGLTEAGLVYQS